MPPRAQPCPHCGQMFFPASLRFHMKRCQEKQDAVKTECAYCFAEMPQGKLEEHLRKCKAALAVAASATGQPYGAAGSGEAGGEAGGAPVATRLPDGRMRCHFCGRGFAANRVHMHAAICGKLKQARPKPPVQQHQQQPVQEVQPFEQEECAPCPPAVQEDALPQEELRQPEPVQQEDWRSKRQDFLAAVRAARRNGAKQGAQEAGPTVQDAAEQEEQEHEDVVVMAPAHQARSEPVRLPVREPAREPVREPAREPSRAEPSSQPRAKKAAPPPSGSHKASPGSVSHRSVASTVAAPGSPGPTRLRSAPGAPSQAWTAAAHASEEASAPSRQSHSCAAPPGGTIAHSVPAPGSPAPVKALRSPQLTRRGSKSPDRPATAEGGRRSSLTAPPAQAATEEAISAAAFVAAAVASGSGGGGGGAPTTTTTSVFEPAQTPDWMTASLPGLDASVDSVGGPASWPARPAPEEVDLGTQAAHNEDTLDIGCRVQVRGLVHAHTLNGQHAVLLDFDLDADCWLARLDSGVVKALRPQNVAKAEGVGRLPSRGSPPTPARQSSLASSSGTPAKPANTGTVTSSLGPRRSKGGATSRLLESEQTGTLGTPKTRIPKAPRSTSAEPRPKRTLSPESTRSSLTTRASEHILDNVVQTETLSRRSSAEAGKIGGKSLISPRRVSPGRTSRSLKAPAGGTKDAGTILEEDDLARSMSLPPTQIPRPRLSQGSPEATTPLGSKDLEVAKKAVQSLRASVEAAVGSMQDACGSSDTPRMTATDASDYWDGMQAVVLTTSSEVSDRDAGRAQKLGGRLVSAPSQVGNVPYLENMPNGVKTGLGSESTNDIALSTQRTLVDDQECVATGIGQQPLFSAGGLQRAVSTASSQLVHVQQVKAIPVYAPQPVGTAGSVASTPTTMTGHSIPMPSFPSTPSTATTSTSLLAVAPGSMVAASAQGHTAPAIFAAARTNPGGPVGSCGGGGGGSSTTWAAAVANLDVRLGPGPHQQQLLQQAPTRSVPMLTTVMASPPSSLRLPVSNGSPPPSLTPVLATRGALTTAAVTPLVHSPPMPVSASSSSNVSRMSSRGL